MKFNKKIAAGVAASTVVVAGGGVAYAFWTTTGGGSGFSTDSAAPGTVSEVATFDASALAPGGTGVSVAYSASNTSPTSLSVAAPTATVTSDKTYTKADSSTSSCADFLHLTAGTVHGGVVPAGTTAASPVSLGSATLSYDDSTTLNQDSCKGQKITITLASS
jgi:hypothetical protein